MHHLVFALFICSCIPASAQVYQQAFSLHGSDQVRMMREDAAGNTWIAGTTSDTVSGFTDFFVVKTNSQGDTIFTRSYGTTGYEDLTAACLTSDGGILLGGTSLDTAQWIVTLKVSPAGAVQWSKLFLIEIYEEVTDVIQASDGGYLLYGSAHVTPGVFLMKIDAGGALMWETELYDGISDYMAAASVEQYQNEYIFTGTRAGSVNDVFMGAVSLSGALTWCYDLGLANCFVTDFASIGGGNFILGGYAQNSTEAFLAKANYDSIAWAYTYTLPGAVFPEDIAIDQDGNILMAGTVMNAFTSSYVLKADAAGTKKWCMLYPDNTIGIAVSCASNGDYVVGGGIYGGVQNGQIVAYALRADTAGTTSCGNYIADGLTTVLFPVSSPASLTSSFNVLTANYQVTVGSGAQTWNVCPVGIDEVPVIQPAVYPNPFSDYLVVDLSSHTPSPAGFYLYDTYGRLVRTETLAGEAITIQRGDLPPGIYFYRIDQEGQITGSGKVAAK